MCGIAGFLGRFEKSLLSLMNQSIAHRGPDDSGIFFDAAHGVGLAHRRLSIIDLSVLGHQPMWDASQTVAIVFNGEVFNFKALQNGLISDGFSFSSNSDTEVLLNLYLRDGEAMLGQLNGMFAFAIWDTRNNSLFIARDGIGVKPLYYSLTPHGFLFASEIKAILQESSVDRTLNNQAIYNHLNYLWSPAPDTILRSVRKLEPGHALIVKDNVIKRHWQFYELPYDQPIEIISEKDAIEMVRHHVEQAVQRQMVADVPVGAFLSGGLDSSSVVAFAQKFSGNQKLQCFTIGIDGYDQSEGIPDDLPYAQKVASHLNVDLHTVRVGPEMIDDLEKMIYHLDEPQADPAPINAMLISQLAREHGVKVLLSGSGGDDIFTGYRRHYALTLERWWRWLPKPARIMLSRFSQGGNQLNSNTRRFAKAFRYADLDTDARISGYFSWIDPVRLRSLYSAEYISSLNNQELCDPLTAALSVLPPSVPALNRMLFLETKFFLADHNLNYMDKMSMATGVEVRVPLLDNDLVALAARLPLNYKQRGATGKWIFKKAMEPYLPHDVIYRPKSGFGAPLRYWLRHELKTRVEDLLSTDSLKNRGLFDPVGVNNLIADDRAGRVDGSYTIFSLMCIELWCRIFIDKQRPSLP